MGVVSPSHRCTVCALQKKGESSGMILKGKAVSKERKGRKGIKTPWEVNERVYLVLMGRPWTPIWAKSLARSTRRYLMSEGWSGFNSASTVLNLSWSPLKLKLSGRWGRFLGRERTWAQHVHQKKEALRPHLPRIFSFPMFAHRRGGGFPPFPSGREAVAMWADSHPLACTHGWTGFRDKSLERAQNLNWDEVWCDAQPEKKHHEGFMYLFYYSF